MSFANFPKLLIKKFLKINFGKLKLLMCIVRVASQRLIFASWPFRRILRLFPDQPFGRFSHGYSFRIRSFWS